MNHDQIPGWGVDLDPKNRPGVPMQQQPADQEGARQGLLPRQKPRVEVLHRPELTSLTPVFGTAAPPKGLSGVLRRQAYCYPDHQSRRWMLLLLADRVDVWERRLSKLAAPAGLLLLAATSAAAATRLRQA